MFATLLRLGALIALPLAAAGAASAQYDDPQEEAALILFSGVGYQGAAVNVFEPIYALKDYRFNDQTRSVAILSGAWELCEHSNFTGRCVFLREDVPDLGYFGLGREITSVRPIYEYTDAEHGLMFVRDKNGYIRYADNARYGYDDYAYGYGATTRVEVYHYGFSPAYRTYGYYDPLAGYGPYGFGYSRGGYNTYRAYHRDRPPVRRHRTYRDDHRSDYRDDHRDEHRGDHREDRHEDRRDDHRGGDAGWTRPPRDTGTAPGQRRGSDTLAGGPGIVPSLPDTTLPNRQPRATPSFVTPDPVSRTPRPDRSRREVPRADMAQAPDRRRDPPRTQQTRRESPQAVQARTETPRARPQTPPEPQRQQARRVLPQTPAMRAQVPGRAPVPPVQPVRAQTRAAPVQAAPPVRAAPAAAPVKAAPQPKAQRPDPRSAEGIRDRKGSRKGSNPY